MPPTSLHHTDLGVLKMRQRLQQKIPRRHKVSVKNGDELSSGFIQTCPQRAGFVALPMMAVQQLDLAALFLVMLDPTLREPQRLIRRIIQNLNLQQMPGIIHLTNRANQALNDVDFVENRQLHGYLGKIAQRRRRMLGAAAVLVIQVYHHVTVRAKNKKNGQRDKIKNKYARFKNRIHIKKENPLLSLPVNCNTKIAKTKLKCNLFFCRHTNVSVTKDKRLTFFSLRFPYGRALFVANIFDYHSATVLLSTSLAIFRMASSMAACRFGGV